MDNLRRTNRKRYLKRRKIVSYISSCAVLALSVSLGFAFGVNADDTKTIEVVTEVEPIVYEKDVIPAPREITIYDIPLSDNLQRYITEIASDKNVPVPLVLAIIEHESGFDQDAISPTHDYGLMQINKINHEHLEEEYRCDDLLNPYQNVFCGVSIIGSCLEKYEGDCTKALMAYNMGDYGAQKAWGNGINSTKYSESIINTMIEYENLQNGK